MRFLQTKRLRKMKNKPKWKWLSYALRTSTWNRWIVYEWLNVKVSSVTVISRDANLCRGGRCAIWWMQLVLLNRILGAKWKIEVPRVNGLHRIECTFKSSRGDVTSKWPGIVELKTNQMSKPSPKPLLTTSSKEKSPNHIQQTNRMVSLTIAGNIYKTSTKIKNDVTCNWLSFVQSFRKRYHLLK